MTIVKPAPFHPWGFKAHLKREDFNNEAVYWRHWAERLQLSPTARLRLEWMIFYKTVAKGNASFTAKHFGISRKTFMKWKARFNVRDLTSLQDKSKAPKKKRNWTVTVKEEANIIVIRNDHLKWGKEKLKREYLKSYGQVISTNKIQKVINKHQLYPEPKEHKKRVKRARKRRHKTYLHNFTKQKKLGFLWHTDAIVLWWYGTRKVIFTAIEEFTKIGYARVYSTNSSRNAKDFLERLRYLSGNQLDNIHHDHGSEFFGEFEQACQELKVQQIFSRVRTPTDNAALERFNWTVQDEWLSLSEVGLDSIDEANDDLTQWLIEYNSERPHQSLGYQTPLEYGQRVFKVSPMWSSSTMRI
jgi:transposase InsO family protein